MRAAACKVYEALIRGQTKQFMTIAFVFGAAIIFAQTIAIVLLVHRVQYSNGVVENMVHASLQADYVRNHKYYHTKYEIGNGTYFDQLLLQGVRISEHRIKPKSAGVVFDCAASMRNVKCSLQGNHHVWVEQDTVNIFRPPDTDEL